jgi:ABC-type transport system involved in multi-copper enzyme maturation permease subunit
MPWRVGVVMLNTYREAVRARVLHGLFALALATCGYTVIVGEFAARTAMRVVSDLGSASISIYGIVVAVVLAATSLYRELELKTIFPMLARPIHRSEYLIGKYLGTLLTIAVFVVANSAVLLLALALMADRGLGVVGGSLLAVTAVFGIAMWRLPRARTYLPIFWSLAALALGYALASGAPDDRRVITAAAALTLFEVAIVAAVATVFAAFSSPFLTATFTFGVFVVGRSADTLAHLPPRVFGTAIQAMGEVLSKVVPNLMLYVPPRPILTGEAISTTLAEYLPRAALYAGAWSVGLLALASVVFRRRDFL